MDLTTWLAFVTATIVLLMIPGPTVLLVLSYAIGQGRRVAVSTALGVGLGDLIAMTASLLGLGALVLASATLFTALKWAGAAYLAYLGIKLWRSAGDAALPLQETRNQSGVFWHACIVTALNPKSIAFFIAFVPQFIDPRTALAPQFAIMISTFVGLRDAERPSLCAIGCPDARRNRAPSGFGLADPDRWRGAGRDGDCNSYTAPRLVSVTFRWTLSAQPRGRLWVEHKGPKARIGFGLRCHCREVMTIL